MVAPTNILEMRPEELRVVRRFRFDALELPGGRITIFEPPHPDHDYATGADFALGLTNRDYDAAVVLDASTDPIRQVATVHGHWGERFDRVLFSVLRHYNDSFLMGERQYGLAILRALLEQYDHAWLWYERDYAKRAKRQRDALGWPKHGKRARDPLLRGLRNAVSDRSVWLRDEALIMQLGALQFCGPDSKEPEELLDDDLDIKLQGGGSPDLVMAAMYAWTAVTEMMKYDKPTPKYPAGTLGDVLGHEELEGEDEAPLYTPQPQMTRRSRRRFR